MKPKGSSPLTRGKLQAPRRAQARGGLIPAHAGKTSLRVRRSVHLWAHPRSRGENARTTHREHDGGGSSPLTRGKHASAIIEHREHGLIPAHAGKTSHVKNHWRAAQAHPRSRGENLPDEMATCQAGGSSPLTRGKRRPITRRRKQLGLIPAHAGKTTTRHALTLAPSGSSPLTRGKLVIAFVASLTCGLIPAHAGKTRSL